MIIAGALSAYFVALLFQGYGYAVDDQIEIIPVLKYWLSGGELYSHDFYVQSFTGKTLTERTPFLLLLYYTVGVSPMGFFISHALCSILLFAGIILIVEKLTSSPVIGFMTSIVLVTLGTYTSLGGNEIYYHYLIPSLPAKAMSVWAIFFWLNRTPLTSFLLIAIATYIQPLVGLQVFVILTIAGLVIHRDKITSLVSILLYGVIAGPWIFLLLSVQHTGEGLLNYLDIIEFRVAHHFFASYFGWENYVVLALFALAIYLCKGRSYQPVRSITAIVILIAGIYIIGSVFLPVPLIMNSQWFKTTIWVELFGIMAILVWVRDIIRLNADRYATPLIILTLTSLVILQASGLKQPSYGPPLGQIDTPESLIAIWAKENTPQDAVFILPPDFNSFKSLSERSSYVDFKAMIHHTDYMSEYYHRIHEIYGINVAHRRQMQLSDMLNLAEKNMNDQVSSFSEKADYLVTRAVITDSTVVPVYKPGEIDGYYVYRLN